MNANKRHIVIIGSTGLIGRSLIESLLEESSVEVITAITRKSLSLAHPKLREEVIENFSISKIESLDIGGDIFINCLGTTMNLAKTKEKFLVVDHDYVLAFAKLAIRNSAKCFISISALGANSRSLVFYNSVKGRVEVELKQLNFESLYILRPSLLIGERTQKRSLESLAISFYKLTKKFLPKSVQIKLGTEVSQIIIKITELVKKCDKGSFVIEQF